jgi:CRISPR/Cas system-associated endoribonuclease Cas2
MKKKFKKGYCHRVVNSRNVFRGHVGKFTVLDLYKVRRASVDEEDKMAALFLLPNTKNKYIPIHDAQLWNCTVERIS